MFESKKSKKFVDSRDRDILRLLYGGRRPMTGNQISKKVALTPPTVNLRLSKLFDSGLIKRVKVGKLRTLSSKKSVKITAPSKILWGLDMIKKERKSQN